MGINIDIDVVISGAISTIEQITYWLPNTSGSHSNDQHEWIPGLMAGCWVLWKERCECIFQNKTSNHLNVVARIHHH